MTQGCTDCFKDVRSRRDKLIQTQTDATKYATENQKKVAILPEGEGFTFEVFTETIPTGTIEIIVPGK